MNITEAFNDIIDAIIANGSLAKSAARDILIAVAPDLRNQEASGWIDAVAVMYADLGIINNGTWASLRNEISNEGAVTAKKLFNALGIEVGSLVETQTILVELLRRSLRDQRDLIPVNIASLEGFKTGEEQLDTALDLAINALHQREQAIRDELRGLPEIITQ